MNTPSFVTADEVRSRFSRAMSDMYRDEVPQYSALLDLVADINQTCLQADSALRDRLRRNGELDRLGVERHGAICLGKAEEFSMMRSIFLIVGMAPVGYYDLPSAGVPVHSTAFRPVDESSLARNPFRIFTPIIYNDFLPVSAACIFQPSLSDAEQCSYAAGAAKGAFEAALGASVLDEIALYKASGQRSVDLLKQSLYQEETI